MTTSNLTADLVWLLARGTIVMRKRRGEYQLQLVHTERGFSTEAPRDNAQGPTLSGCAFRLRVFVSQQERKAQLEENARRTENAAKDT